MILNNELIGHQKRARAYLNDAHTQPTLTERSERIIKGLNVLCIPGRNNTITISGSW